MPAGKRIPFAAYINLKRVLKPWQEDSDEWVGVGQACCDQDFWECSLLVRSQLRDEGCQQVDETANEVQACGQGEAEAPPRLVSICLCIEAETWLSYTYGCLGDKGSGIILEAQACHLVRPVGW